MSDVAGLSLGFTAHQWIAPGDQIRFELATGEVRVVTVGQVDIERVGDVDEVVRIITAARDELDALREAAAETDQARLTTAAAGVTLVLAWLEPHTIAFETDDEDEEAPEPVAQDPSDPVTASPASDAEPAPVPVPRPPGMPEPGDQGTCEMCGEPVPYDDAKFSFARHRKVLCRTPEGGCFALHGRTGKKAAKESANPAGDEETT